MLLQVLTEVEYLVQRIMVITGLITGSQDIVMLLQKNNSINSLFLQRLMENISFDK